MKRSLESSSCLPFPKLSEGSQIGDETQWIENYESKQKKVKYESNAVIQSESILQEHKTRVILIDLMKEHVIHHHQHDHHNLQNSSYSDDDVNLLLRKFKRKIGNLDGSKSRECAFSANFHHSSTIVGLENDDEEVFSFLYPYDVKICYNLKLLFVSGTDESKIVVYSLDNYKFIRVIELETMPTNLCIEEWDKNCNHIIISGNDSFVYKYSLEECMRLKSKPLWICEKIKSPNGIISIVDKNNSNDKYRKETALLYICDMFNEMISIVKSLSGEVIGKINLGSELIHVSCPWSIGMNSLGHLIVSGLQNSTKHIIEILEKFHDQKTNQQGWRSIKTIENDEDKLKYPFGLVVDGVSSNIIICDSLNHRCLVLKQDGTIVKVFGTKGKELNQLSTPMGLCINKLTGQLLVADSENHRIYIFD